MTAAAATILDPYGTIMPYPPKSPLKLCYKIGKRNITHPFHTAILKEMLEKIYSYYHRKKCSAAGTYFTIH